MYLQPVPPGRGGPVGNGGGERAPRVASPVPGMHGQCAVFYIICVMASAGCEMQESEPFDTMAEAICLQVYRETLRGVVTACRRYKDELLEACLQLLLSAPTSVMTIHVRALTSAACSLSLSIHL